MRGASLAAVFEVLNFPRTQGNAFYAYYDSFYGLGNVSFLHYAFFFNIRSLIIIYVMIKRHESFDQSIEKRTFVIIKILTHKFNL